MKKIILAMGFLGIFAGNAAITSAGYFNTAPIYRCDSGITRYLSIGSENNDVYTLQQVLVREGYLYATPTGYFGYATKQAVKNFQLDNNIYANGVVNWDTREAINEQLCDTSYNTYSSDSTYVDGYDPYVYVISPTVTTPVVYPANHSTSHTTDTNSTVVYSSNGQSTNQIQSTNIIYSPYTGYTYGIVPQSGSLTITSPLQNSSYREGDTVNLSWSTNNLNSVQFGVLLENSSTGQSKAIGYTGGNNYSFVLTKEVLDAVCAGACDNNNANSYRIVVTTPTTDIAGITSNLRAAISPISISRPYSLGTVSISGSKSPVNSGEIFKLYTNIPTSSSYNSSVYNNFTFKIHAICPASVSVSIAGVACGQDFSVPVSSYLDQGIPASITNPTWYKQDVTFEIVVSNLAGQVVGTAQTNVAVNPAPFSW